MRKRSNVGLVAVAAALFLPACWVTSGEFDHSRSAMEARIHALESSDQQRRQQTDDRTNVRRKAQDAGKYSP